VTEWKLFDRTPPEPPEILPGRGWMNLAGQPGFTQRSAMVVDLVRLVTSLRPVWGITDLGCGDGSLLSLLAPLGEAWGYDLGAADVAYAQGNGLDARVGDITAGGLELGDLLVATEVVEHLAEPVKFLSSLPTARRVLVLSSPSAETGLWHNEIHAWAWDLDGYRDLVERAGWRVVYQTECDGGPNVFGGVTGPQRFQAVVAVP